MTSSDLSKQRRDFAVAREDAAFHFIAIAREKRGMAWDGGSKIVRATEQEREYGIGYSDTFARRQFADNARAIRSGFCLPR